MTVLLWIYWHSPAEHITLSFTLMSWWMAFQCVLTSRFMQQLLLSLFGLQNPTDHFPAFAQVPVYFNKGRTFMY